MDKEFQAYLTNELLELKSQVAQVQVEIAKLKVVSSLWGGLSGLGAAVGVVIWKLLL